MNTNQELHVYIVTQNHNQDYVSSTVYLTVAQDEKNAIINAMGYDSGLVEWEYGRSQEETERLEQQERERRLALDLHELEQHDRDNGDVWSAELFELPVLTKAGETKQIAKLDSD